jgi:hypothetical protein
MSSKKRKEKKKLQSGWYRLYRFFFPADLKASIEKGQGMGAEWRAKRELEMRRGMEITGERATWLTKIPFIGGIFKKSDELQVGETREEEGQRKRQNKNT